MMKKFLTIAILLMMLLPCGQGQAPQKMTAQMVLRDANGLLIANQQVSVRISIRRTLPAGITVYSETHTATTNANGLYTVFVGEGMPTVGTFGTIDWGNGPYYIASEVDPAGGTNYTLQTVQQLVSVPYALYADSAYRCAEHQVLTLSHDTLRLTGGSFVRLPQSVSQRYVDSVVAANRVSTVRLDSLRRANDSIAHRYDSVFNVMRQRLDSVVAAGGSSSGGTGGGSTPSPTPGPTPNPSCTGLNTTGSESRTECDRYTWPVNNQTYTATTTATGTIYGGNAVGCDSTVTLALTIKQGSYNSYSQTSSTSYTWHGTSYSATGTYTYNYTNSVGCPSVDTLHLTVSTTPTPVAGCSCSVASSGTLPGKFSVSAIKKVKFSQGNLQYQASTKTWRFAQCQKQYMDTNNNHVSATYTGWIDLFGWGTSGFHNPADASNVNYYPYSTANSDVNTTYNRYGYGPSENLAQKDLTGQNARYDWGVYNAISNGGNAAGMWRTLTSAEWKYLLETRTVSSTGMTNARYCKANVGGSNGLIIFPDTFALPSGLPSPVGVNTSSSLYANNYYDDTQWARMEAAGAVFLPAAGNRVRTSINSSNSNSRGFYWSTSTYVPTTSGQTNKGQSAYYLNFYNDLISPQGYITRYSGASVRLVQDTTN